MSEPISAADYAQTIEALNKRFNHLVRQKLEDVELRKWCVERALTSNTVSMREIYDFVTQPLTALVQPSAD